MLEQLGLIGTIRDDDESPEEPDTESEPEVSLAGHTVPMPGTSNSSNMFCWRSREEALVLFL